MSPTGVVAREAFGVARWVFPLENRVPGRVKSREEGINLSQKQDSKQTYVASQYR